MTPSERQQSLADYLDSVGVCSYQDLARLLNVSEMTIRRDVDKLVLRHKVIKTLGGVQTAHAPRNLYESPVQQRLPILRAEKEQIAREAMRQIEPHRTIFLDGSTTCLVLARHLAKQMTGLTIVTCSSLVCLEFGPTTGNTIFSLGGQFDPASAVSSARQPKDSPDSSSWTSLSSRPRDFVRRRARSSRRSPRFASSRSSRSRPPASSCWRITRSSAKRPVQGVGHWADPRGDYRRRHDGGSFVGAETTRRGRARGVRRPSASGVRVRCLLNR